MVLAGQGQPTQVITMDENFGFIADLTTRQTTFCSYKAETPEQKAILFKAMNNPEKRISEMINMEISVKDIFCEVVVCKNEQTGEATQCPRIVLIDDKGVGYQAVSLGVFSAIKKVIQVFGQPTWTEPITLAVKQITKDKKSLLTFDVVATPTKK